MKQKATIVIVDDGRGFTITCEFSPPIDKDQPPSGNAAAVQNLALLMLGAIPENSIKSTKISDGEKWMDL